MRHVPVWTDRSPRHRRPAFPTLRGDHEASVVIVGGGLTGAACALSLAAAGIQSILVEAERVGGGLTAGTAGILREGFAGAFRDAVTAHGLRTSRTLWDGMRRGGLDFAAALRRYAIKCDLEPRDLITLTGRGPDAVRTLRREYEARHSSNIGGSWMTAAAVGRETGIESGGGIRTHGFSFDPLRACLGLARAAVERGAEMFEGSPVQRIRTVKRRIEVSTAHGVVRADWVIVATGAPIRDLRALRRHLSPEHVYGVLTEPLPAAMRRGTGTHAAALEDGTAGHRYVRFLPDHRVLISSGRQPEVAARARDRALVQRTGQLMYELLLLYPDIAGLQPASSWDRLDHETADGLPFIGPHRNFPRHFFAFGSSRHGDGSAWLGARMALRFILGESARGDEAFGFHRIL